MARQRFIHPDIWSDPSLGRLKPVERLFFIGCFSNADDEGRLLGNSAFLRATIFPYDDMPLDEVKAIRNRTVAICKNLVFYEVDGVEYLAFLKWDKYQKPRYPKPSKLPPPPPPSQKNDLTMEQNSGNVDESFPQNSGNVDETLEKHLHPRLGMDRVKDRDGLCLGENEEGAEETENHPPGNCCPPANKNQEKTKIKIKYAEFVSLTDDEYLSLTAKLGNEERVKRCIEILDNYKGAHGKKYKSDYRAILAWVISKLREEEQRQKHPKGIPKPRDEPEQPKDPPWYMKD